MINVQPADRRDWTTELLCEGAQHAAIATQCHSWPVDGSGSVASPSILLIFLIFDHFIDMKKKLK